ncbi:MAG TPA: copper resistance CopC family protein [Humisphaera sp.]|nr:copper resistance CopC family protein [Humisphaera sp.]
MPRKIPKLDADPTRIQYAYLAIVLLLAMTGVASAHAFVDRAEPKVGAESNSAPTEVKIWFTQQIEPAFSKIRVLDADGKQVDKKDLRQDKDNKKLLIVSLPHLAPGTYKVEWKVVSVDTHRTSGDFKFTIKP